MKLISWILIISGFCVGVYANIKKSSFMIENPEVNEYFAYSQFAEYNYWAAGMLIVGFIIRHYLNRNN